MKLADLRVGAVYHDGKQGVREIVDIDGPTMKVRYRLLAAKQEQKWSFREEKMLSLLGEEYACSLEAFSTWARGVLAPMEVAEYVLLLKAMRVKLTPSEDAFLRRTAEIGGGAGMLIGYRSNEGRVVNGLKKKGIIVYSKPSVAELTELGATWLRTMLRNENEVEV